MGLKRSLGGRWGIAFGALAVAFVSPIFAPQLLAFPYRAVTPIGTVWSERPISPENLATTSAMVQARMATTPLAGPDERRLLFLTEGGWRWIWLTQRQSSLAISRPFTKAVIVNRTNVVGDAAMRSTTNGRKRTLASLLAHEFTHGLIRRRYGVARSLMFAVWKVEGYCDHVAGESTLDAEAVAKLEAAHQSHPALIYYRGRERVEAELARNGGDVDALFSGA